MKLFLRNYNMEILISYIIIGIISTLAGMISINLLIEKTKRKKYNNFKTAFIFFSIGIIIHVVVQQLKLDELYCDKQCMLRQINS